MRLLSALFACLLLCGFVAAQDSPSPYEIALERIREAETSGETILYLSGLGLTELPPEIGNLHQLESLYLVFNQLTELPPEIGELLNLQVLDIWDNKLQTLPPEIGKLRLLCYLNLGHNPLQYLPLEFGLLHRLEDPSPVRISEDTVSTCTGFVGLYLPVNNTFISPPQEVIAQGTPAILDYLRNEAWWHLQKLIMSGLGILGAVTLLVLGLRWRNRRGKEKRKIHH